MELKFQEKYMDLIDEVAKDIKDEKHYNAFKKALPIVIIITLVLVIAMSIKSWMENRARKHNAEMGDLLNNAVVLSLSGQKQAADESFDYILKEAKNHSKDLSALGKAIQNTGQDQAGSLKALEEIAENRKYLDLTRLYAQILWLSVVVDFPSDKVDDNKMTQYLDNFKDEKQTFYGTANLIKAMWLSKQGKDAEAEVVLNNILNSKNVNFTNHNNAQAILANIKAKKYSK
jgi:hypothetical protein